MRLSAGAANDLEVETLWDAFSQMKFDAATVSSEDLPDVDKLPPTAKAMLTVANVTYQIGPLTGKPIAQPVLYKTVQLASRKKAVVAIIGLLGDPPYQTVPNPANSPADKPWKVEDPAAALKRVLPAARARANIVVVMYAGTRGPARNLLKDNAGVDVMIAGLEGSVDHRPELVGSGVLVQNAERGRYAGQLGITLDANRRPVVKDAYDLRTSTLDATYTDDPAMVEMIKVFKDKQTKIRPPVTVISTPTPVKSDWAGSYMCASCHTAEFNQWKTTKHFVAMVTLESKDSGQPARRNDCVSCHVVAFNKPGGYTLAQPRWDLKGVGCESCHGPAAAHVDAQLKKTADTSKLIANPGKDTCITCHNPDNSPNFDFATYRAKIVHKPAAAAGAH